MTTSPAGPSYSPAHPDRAYWSRHRRRVDARATLALSIIAAIGGLALGAALLSLTPADFSTYGILYAASVIAAVSGTYLSLVLLLLSARIPAIERAFGHDRLITIHKMLGPWAIYLVLAHILLVLQSQATAVGTNIIREFLSLMATDQHIPKALIGTILFLAGGLTSWRLLRNHLSHQVWWGLHLAFYVGTALAFFHQISSGGPFLSGWARVLWIGLYAIVFGALFYFRLVRPLWRSARYQLRVEKVMPESHNVVSVIMHGRGLDRLRIKPGQFMNFRFDTPGLRLEAHPYSLSGIAPGTDRVRITVKALGDASALVADLKPGTRVAFEGPYGAATPDRLTGERVVLVAGGVGIAPVRALAEGFAGRLPVDVIYRASTEGDLALDAEFAALARISGVRYHPLPGSRVDLPLDTEQLRALVGTLEDADLYICGPEALAANVTRSARALGISPRRIHQEEYNL